MITVTHPVPFQVIQRTGFQPRDAHVNCAGGPRLGSARVRLAWSADAPPRSYRLRVSPSGTSGQGPWIELVVRTAGKEQESEVELPAGWYRGELAGTDASGREVILPVGPFGIGEVYLVAGQSYAANCNDALVRIDDTDGRVTAMDYRTGAWRVAHDPQPSVQEPTGSWGTIWPPAMNLLLPMVRVPIGMVNVAVGATASREWMPGTPLFANLLEAGRRAGDFRAVLWQQGESDVIERIDTAEYTRRIRAMKTALDDAWGISRPLLAAKSTLHPTVYVEPKAEGAIREAIGQLWRTPGFFPGPDTDILGGENRSARGGSEHFTLIGQQRAGQLWFAALWNHLCSLEQG